MQLTWQIGAVTVTRIEESEYKIPYNAKRPFIPEATPDALATIPWLYPNFVTREGYLRLSVQALLVEAPGLRVVVDTCIGNDKPRRFASGALHTEFLEHLAAAGWSRESVDVVLCTHMHVDHVGWNTMLEDGKWTPTFPRARYLFARKELEYWSSITESEQTAIMADSIQPIFDAGLADLVAMDHRVSKEISLVPSAGHTPGHVSVAIQSQGKRALITGDFIHHPCQIARPEWCPNSDSDAKLALDLRQSMIAELADSETLVIGTHFSAPTAGYIKRAADHYTFKS